MASRYLIGSLVLTAIIAGLASTAPAQERSGRIKALVDRAREKRAQPSDPNPTRMAAPGAYRFHFIHGGIRRDYLVHVPAKAIGHPAPMLLALHGGGGDMDYQAQNYGIVEKADEAGFIAVFPNGTTPMLLGLTKHADHADRRRSAASLGLKSEEQTRLKVFTDASISSRDFGTAQPTIEAQAASKSNDVRKFAMVAI